MKGNNEIKVKATKEKNSIFNYVDIILGTVILVYTIVINCISSVIVAFSSAFIIFGLALIIYHFVKKNMNRFIKNSKNKLLKRSYICIKVLFIIGIVFMCIIEGFIIGYPKNNTEKAEYIVVLGAGLRAGNQITMTLKDRLDAAIEVSSPNSYIVVSGGKGNDEKISEAEAMEKYLLDCGIDKNRIIKEDQSKDTAENLRFSKEKIQKSSKKDIDLVNVKIVTTDFHACRAAFIAKKNNYKNFTVYTSKSLTYLIPIYYSRECFAMVKFLINNL